MVAEETATGLIPIARRSARYNSGKNIENKMWTFWSSESIRGN